MVDIIGDPKVPSGSQTDRTLRPASHSGIGRLIVNEISQILRFQPRGEKATSPSFLERKPAHEPTAVPHACLRPYFSLATAAAAAPAGCLLTLRACVRACLPEACRLAGLQACRRPRHLTSWLGSSLDPSLSVPACGRRWKESSRRKPRAGLMARRWGRILPCAERHPFLRHQMVRRLVSQSRIPRGCSADCLSAVCEHAAYAIRPTKHPASTHLAICCRDHQRL